MAHACATAVAASCDLSSKTTTFVSPSGATTEMADAPEETDHPAGAVKVTPAAVTCGVSFGLASCGHTRLGAYIPIRTDNHSVRSLLVIWGDYIVPHGPQDAWVLRDDVTHGLAFRILLRTNVVASSRRKLST